MLLMSLDWTEWEIDHLTQHLFCDFAGRRLVSTGNGSEWLSRVICAERELEPRGDRDVSRPKSSSYS
jgi:hypothetical protein